MPNEPASNPSLAKLKSRHLPVRGREPALTLGSHCSKKDEFRELHQPFLAVLCRLSRSLFVCLEFSHRILLIRPLQIFLILFPLVSIRLFLLLFPRIFLFQLSGAHTFHGTLRIKPSPFPDISKKAALSSLRHVINPLSRPRITDMHVRGLCTMINMI